MFRVQPFQHIFGTIKMCRPVAVGLVEDLVSIRMQITYPSTPSLQLTL